MIQMKERSNGLDCHSLVKEETRRKKLLYKSEMSFKRTSFTFKSFSFQVIIFDTTNKLAMFRSSKDQITADQEPNLVYCFTCPGCNEKYIGKN